MRPFVKIFLIFICFPGFAQETTFSNDELFHAKNRLEVRQTVHELLMAYRFGHKNRLAVLHEKIEKIKPDSAEVWYFRALRFYSQGEKGRASMALEESLKISEKFDPALNLMGLILSQAERTEEAARFFQSAVELSPYDPTYVYNLAHAYYGMGRLYEAHATVEKALNLKQNFADARYLNALILKDEGKLDLSLLNFSEARQLGFRSIEFYKDYLDVAEKAGKDDIVFDICELREIQTLPEFQRIHARTRLRYGEYKKAAEILERFVKTKYAVVDDKKNYLYSLFKLNLPYKEKVISIATDMEEKKLLFEYADSFKQLSQTNTGVRDPIVVPAK